jgi:hypothetical protein
LVFLFIILKVATLVIFCEFQHSFFWVPNIWVDYSFVIQENCLNYIFFFAIIRLKLKVKGD